MFQRRSSADTSGDATAARQGRNAQRSHVATLRTELMLRDYTTIDPFCTARRTDRLQADSRRIGRSVSGRGACAHTGVNETTAQRRESSGTFDTDARDGIGVARNPFLSPGVARAKLRRKGNLPIPLATLAAHDKRGFPSRPHHTRRVMIGQPKRGARLSWGAPPEHRGGP